MARTAVFPPMDDTIVFVISGIFEKSILTLRSFLESLPGLSAPACHKTQTKDCWPPMGDDVIMMHLSFRHVKHYVTFWIAGLFFQVKWWWWWWVDYSVFGWSSSGYLVCVLVHGLVHGSIFFWTLAFVSRPECVSCFSMIENVWKMAGGFFRFFLCFHIPFF